jgi:hypothetical protein
MILNNQQTASRCNFPSMRHLDSESRFPSSGSADERRQAMSHSISTLLLRNLNDVFGEMTPCVVAAIDEIFREDAVFYDPKGGIFHGRDEIDRIAGVIKATIQISNISAGTRIVPQLAKNS